MSSTKKASPKLKSLIGPLIVIVLFGAVAYPSIKQQYFGEIPEKIVEKVIEKEKVVRDRPTIAVNSLRVIPIRVIDADTLYATVELPLSVTLVNQRIRCLGYDAYELSEVNGLAAKKEFETLLASGQAYGMTGDRPFDDFGRCLLSIYIRKDNEVISVADWMKEHKFVKPPKEKVSDEISN